MSEPACPSNREPAEHRPPARLVLICLAVDAPRWDQELRALAAAVGARLAYLQLGSPTLTDVLDSLAEEDTTTAVELISVPVGGTPAPAVSWVRRVAGDWLRRHPGILRVEISERMVTGAEAGLTSPGWEAVPGHGRHVLVCRGPRCAARGAAETAEAIREQVRARGLQEQVLLAQTGCLFPCNHAPVVVVNPGAHWWGPVTADDATDLVAAWAGTALPRANPVVRRPGPASQAGPS
ncbi:MAG: NAD(P)H-dependent oxidoreductase subunit E [Propionicimonas sp.]